MDDYQILAYLCVFVVLALTVKRLVNGILFSFFLCRTANKDEPFWRKILTVIFGTFYYGYQIGDDATYVTVEHLETGEQYTWKPFFGRTHTDD